MFKIDVTSLKLEAKKNFTLTWLARTHDLVRLVPKSFLRSTDWLMHLELGYFAHRLISGVNCGAASLNRMDKTSQFFFHIVIFSPMRTHHVMILNCSLEIALIIMPSRSDI